MTAAEELRNAVMSYVESELTRLESEHLLRKQHVFSTPQLPVSLVDGRRMLIFSSSNYLSFGEKKWKMPAWENLSAGSGGSRLTTGNSTAHERLEEKLRSFFGVSRLPFFSARGIQRMSVSYRRLDERRRSFPTRRTMRVSSTAVVLRGRRLRFIAMRTWKT